MTRTVIEDLRSRNAADLHALLLEKRNELRALKFDLSQKKVKNVRLLHNVKKDIARILTALRIKNTKTY